MHACRSTLEDPTLEPGETSPHDQLPPEVSCDAIFAHVTEGIVTARKAGLHERIVDFMHMHHGNGVLEYFWGKTKEQGNPQGLSIEQFRYPGHPPQSRETAILAICDAVEAASRTLKKPDAASIDSLVQRIVYGKLHLGQLDESGLSMSDLRRISDSLRETIRHANHGRIEYPWQKAQQDASAAKETAEPTTTSPRLDSLDRAPAQRETSVKATPGGDSGRISDKRISGESTNEVALAATADIKGGGRTEQNAIGVLQTAPAIAQPPAPAAGEAASDSGRRRRSSAPPLDPIRGGRPPTDPPIELQRKTPVDDELRTQPTKKRPSDRPNTQPPPLELRPPSNPRLTALDSRVLRPPTEPPSDVRDLVGDLSKPSVDDRSLRPPTQPPPFDLRRPSDPNMTLADGRAGSPPSGMITPALFGEQPPREARKRAATLPPISMHQRPPTVPPMGRRHPTMPPFARIGAGPPSPVDLDSAVTHPPPLRRSSNEAIDDDGPKNFPIDDIGAAGLRTPRSSPRIEERVTNERAAASLPPDDASITSPSMPKVEDNSRTEPSMPRFDMPLKAPPNSYPGVTPPPPPPRALGDLAARIDAQLGDEWSTETPVKAPTPAELRALTGSPDPTKQQSLAEIERLHRVANEEVSEPEFLLHRRISPKPTTEVDPDDIESAIEVAPPARRPNAVAVAKPKKSE